MDLPLNDLLAAVVKSASGEFLEIMRRGTPGRSPDAASPQSTVARGAQRPPAKKQTQEAYAALCQFMLHVESSSSTCCGVRSQCPYCHASSRGDGCDCVSWKDRMVRVPNGRGAEVWVKTTNKAHYIDKVKREVIQREKVAREAERSGNGPHA